MLDIPMNNKKRILMVAAENDFLPGAKVGGVADVLRDLPPALVEQGESVDVVIPSYGFLARLPEMVSVGTFDVSFSGKTLNVELLRYTKSNGGADNYIVHHGLFSLCGERIYCNDDDDRPFATDATKFAFFCTAVAEAMLAGLLPMPDVLHCHDWHAAFLFILLKYSAPMQKLVEVTSVFTIHNLAMQGVRPFRDNDSAFEHWYPELSYEAKEICDTRFGNCVNPLRAAIKFADRVHTVSPSYASEILQPSDVEKGIYGGEGLEEDLRLRSDEGNLFGILNGCAYPKNAKQAAPAKKKIASLAQQCILSWAGQGSVLKSAHFIAEKRVQQWLSKKTRGFVMSFVGRVTEQKVGLLTRYVSGEKTALEEILDILGDKNYFILLGSGNKQFEDFLTKVSGRYENFIFLNGYSSELSSCFYRYGDLFLMPSSFEPCGISQMLSMRSRQPCLVNSVGGLRDTVIDGETGFCFQGEGLQQEAVAMVQRVMQLKELYEEDEEAWKTIAHAAAEVRFTWQSSAEQYLEKLYN